MEYPKINSLYKRDVKHQFTSEYAREEFGAYPQWRVEEKIDGQNIRLYVQNGQLIAVKGRTEKAMIPAKLLFYLTSEVFKDRLKGLNDAVLFGEGFGAGIQKGGIYRKDQSFILFDSYINGRWGNREEVYTLSNTLNIHHPHDYGLMDLEDIIALIKDKPQGMYGDNEYEIEGVMCRAEPVVRFNDKNAAPVMFKLKCRDM